ncbi:MAG: MogA/MoaB family molybdenum cofactor biosynthesis protein [Planctomycetes bacterium]|nr:MogA/MoaB family molybdenum cofactor biosynthesis protein [Planctomycetota bacterium]
MANRAVVLTISDSRATAMDADRSGPAVIERLPLLDAILIHREIIPDEIDRIRAALRTWVARCDLIITSGGTGVAERDVTPEAVAPLIERHLPGFGELMRVRAFERLPLSVVSRSGAGISGKTLIIWLPGAAKACQECLEWLAPAIQHTCALLRGERGGH